MEPPNREQAMRLYFPHQRCAVLVLAGSIVWLTGFTFWADRQTAIPLDVPIVLSRAGHVEQDIQVRSAAPQALALVFKIGPVPRQTAMALIGRYSPFDSLGRRTRPSGISVPVRWSIADDSGVVRESGEGDTYGRDGFGATDILRYVAETIRLAPGIYRLRADVLADLPELDGMSINLQLSRHGGKSAFDWRDDVVFFGRLMNLFVIIPATALGAALLIGTSLLKLAKSWRP